MIFFGGVAFVQMMMIASVIYLIKAFVCLFGAQKYGNVIFKCESFSMRQEIRINDQFNNLYSGWRNTLDKQLDLNESL